MFRAVVAAMSYGLLAAGCGPSQSIDRAPPVSLAVTDAAAALDAPPELAPEAAAAPDLAAEPMASPEPPRPAPPPAPPDLAPERPPPPLDAAEPDAHVDAGAVAEVAIADLALDRTSADTGSNLAPLDAGEAPLVKVSYAPAPTSVNLTAAGAIDWVHFGYPGPGSVNRKRGAKPLITMAPIANSEVDHYADRPVRFSWSDGDPTLQVNGISDGINVGGPGRTGFEVRAAGNATRPRLLEIFVGGWEAAGRLVVRFEEPGRPPASALYVDTSFRGQGGADRVYRITFLPATSTQALVVEWTLEAATHPYGNVTLQAAVLAE